MRSYSEKVPNDYNRIERNTLYKNGVGNNDRLKNEVYAITGVGGTVLVLTIIVSLVIVKRYRRKLLENSDSTTFHRNNLDLR